MDHFGCGKVRGFWVCWSCRRDGRVSLIMMMSITTAVFIQEAASPRVGRGCPLCLAPLMAAPPRRLLPNHINHGSTSYWLVENSQHLVPLSCARPGEKPCGLTRHGIRVGTPPALFTSGSVPPRDWNPFPRPGGSWLVARANKCFWHSSQSIRRLKDSARSPTLALWMIGALSISPRP
jgi:hypothetical protein